MSTELVMDNNMHTGDIIRRGVPALGSQLDDEKRLTLVGVSSSQCFDTVGSETKTTSDP